MAAGDRGATGVSVMRLAVEDIRPELATVSSRSMVVSPVCPLWSVVTQSCPKWSFLSMVVSPVYGGQWSLSPAQDGRFCPWWSVLSTVVTVSGHSVLSKMVNFVLGGQSRRLWSVVTQSCQSCPRWSILSMMVSPVHGGQWSLSPAQDGQFCPWWSVLSTVVTVTGHSVLSKMVNSVHGGQSFPQWSVFTQSYPRWPILSMVVSPVHYGQWLLSPVQEGQFCPRWSVLSAVVSGHSVLSTMVNSVRGGQSCLSTVVSGHSVLSIEWPFMCRCAAKKLDYSLTVHCGQRWSLSPVQDGQFCPRWSVLSSVVSGHSVLSIEWPFMYRCAVKKPLTNCLLWSAVVTQSYPDGQFCPWWSVLSRLRGGISTL